LPEQHPKPEADTAGFVVNAASFAQLYLAANDAEGVKNE